MTFGAYLYKQVQDLTSLGQATLPLFTQVEMAKNAGSTTATSDSESAHYGPSSQLSVITAAVTLAMRMYGSETDKINDNTAADILNYINEEGKIVDFGEQNYKVLDDHDIKSSEDLSRR